MDQEVYKRLIDNFTEASKKEGVTPRIQIGYKPSVAESINEREKAFVTFIVEKYLQPVLDFVVDVKKEEAPKKK